MLTTIMIGVVCGAIAGEIAYWFVTRRARKG